MWETVVGLYHVRGGVGDFGTCRVRVFCRAVAWLEAAYAKRDVLREAVGSRASVLCIHIVHSRVSYYLHHTHTSSYSSRLTAKK